MFSETLKQREISRLEENLNVQGAYNHYVIRSNINYVIVECLFEASGKLNLMQRSKNGDEEVGSFSYRINHSPKLDEDNLEITRISPIWNPRLYSYDNDDHYFELLVKLAVLESFRHNKAGKVTHKKVPSNGPDYSAVLIENGFKKMCDDLWVLNSHKSRAVYDENAQIFENSSVVSNRP